MFEQEINLLKEHLPKLEKQNPHGGFVVIKGNEILGLWSSREDALEQGFDKYGNQPFLVKNIKTVNSVVNFSRPIF